MSSTEVLPNLDDPRADFRGKKSNYSVPLKNVSDERHECQVSGIFYVFEPGETLDITDRKEYPRAKMKGLVMGASMTHKEPFTPKGGEADSIAAEILASTKLGQRGVIAILEDGFDAERERLARRRWLAYHSEMCRSTQTWWVAKVAGIMAGNPHALPPVMPEWVFKRLKWLALNDAGYMDRKKWMTKLGGEFDTKGEAVEFLSTVFKSQWADEGEALLIDRDAEMGRVTVAASRDKVVTNIAKPAPQKVQAPIDLPVNDSAWLVDKAAEVGVVLTPKDYEAIIRNDTVALDGIAARIADAAVESEDV